MEPEDSLPRSLKPASYPYREPEKFSPRPPILSIRNLSQADKNLKDACNTTVLEPILWNSKAELCFLSQLMKVQNWYKFKYHHTRSTIKRLLKRSRFNVRYIVY
jgi:hypothetical protein